MRGNQMNFGEESKHWGKKGSIYNCVGRDASLLQEKSMDEQNLFSSGEDIHGKVWVPVQGGGFQTCNEMKTHKTSHVLGMSFCVSICSQQFSAKKWIPVCKEERIRFAGFCKVINGTLPFHASIYSKPFSGSGVIHKELEFRKKTNSETKAKKWVPVQMVERTGSAAVCNVFSDTSPSACGETSDRNLNGKGTLSCGSAISIESKSMEHIALPTLQMTSEENAAPRFENDSAIAVHVSESTNGSMKEEPKGTSQLTIGSQLLLTYSY